MRMTWLGVASLVSVSFSVGCSTGAPVSSQSAALSSQFFTDIAVPPSIATLASLEPRQLPPAVMPPGPSYHQGDDHPIAPSGPACMLCPTTVGATVTAGGWELAGRPDPVEVAQALGAPELSSTISDRIVETEAALADVPASDSARANALVASLARDLDGLMR
jgi:hypothetical protein